MQLAKQAQAYVIATASARSADPVRSDGADDIIDYTRTKLTNAIREPLGVSCSASS